MPRQEGQHKLSRWLPFPLNLLPSYHQHTCQGGNIAAARGARDKLVAFAFPLTTYHQHTCQGGNIAAARGARQVGCLCICNNLSPAYLPGGQYCRSKRGKRQVANMVAYPTKFGVKLSSAYLPGGQYRRGTRGKRRVVKMVALPTKV